MIELLILFELTKSVLTMYGISKEIKREFSVLTMPSYGTIKPALNRLEKLGAVKTQKTMSSGGRPSTYYSITKEGKEYLKKLLLSQPLENPIQFLPNARVRLSCANILDSSERLQLFKILKLKAENIMIDINNLLRTKDAEFYQTLVYDNLVCEYKNFSSLIEGFERAGKN